MPNATLSSLASSLATGATSSRALVEASLSAIVNPDGEGRRAFISVDRDGALAAAGYHDALRKQGRALSPIAGIPFSVKDLFDVAGDVTTAGSRVLQGEAPAAADAPAIARLRAKGMIPIGRTNMTEFAYSGLGLNPHYGTPRSPYDRKTGRIPGGSSSGAGVSVADGMVPLAIGTDTGGSCRIPASYCGVVGYKPSHGVIPLEGVFPLSSSLDTVGPVANSVACCAAAHAIMAGTGDGAVKARAANTLRIAVLKDYVLDGLEPAVDAAFQRTLSRLTKAGVTLTVLAFPELRDIPSINAKGGLLGAEAVHGHRARLVERGESYDPRVAARIRLAEAISAADLLDIQRRRREMIALMAERFAGLDAVAWPTTLNTAPAVAALAEDQDYRRYEVMSLRNTAVGNFLNGCAISIPMQGDGEAPCGFMLFAPWGWDQRLFDVAAGLESTIRPA